MTKAEDRYTPEDVAKFYVYCPLSGNITWKRRVAGMTFGDKVVGERGARQSNGKCAGKSALYDHVSGYKAVAVMGVAFLAHRVAWALYYGTWPGGWIDHVNGVRTDNRIANLRVVDPVGNATNSARSVKNRFGCTGVFFEARANSWIAYIGYKGVRYHLGRHKTKASAVEARLAAEKRFGFHENHGRAPSGR